MKSKLDSGNGKPSQAETGQHEPGNISRLSYGSDRQVDDSTGKDWPVLQVLRRNLKVMGEPLPGSINRLFKLEKKFYGLDAKPKAMTVQGLDQSDALHQSVYMFPFSEQELMREAESSARRQAVEPGTFTRVAGSRNSYPVESNAVGKAAKTYEKLSTLARNRFVVKDSAVSSTENKTETHSPADNNTAAKMLAKDSLTPEFMRQWIDEILSANIRDGNTVNKKGHSIEKFKRSRSVDPVRMDSPRQRSAELNGFLGNENVKRNSKKTMLAEGSLLSRKITPDNVETVAPQASLRASGNNLTVATDRISSEQRNALPGASPGASAQNPDTALEGVTLLQQLVQVEESTAASESVLQKKAHKGTKQKISGADKNRLANNSIRQQMENGLQPISSVVRGITENAMAPLSVEAATAPQSLVYLDESERVASLVNEVLVEQAIRHGVDLS